MCNSESLSQFYLASSVIALYVSSCCFNSCFSPSEFELKEHFQCVLVCVSERVFEGIDIQEDIWWLCENSVWGMSTELHIVFLENVLFFSSSWKLCDSWVFQTLITLPSSLYSFIYFLTFSSPTLSSFPNYFHFWMRK